MQKRETSVGVPWRNLMPQIVDPKEIRPGTVTDADHQLLLWSLEETIQTWAGREEIPVFFELGTHWAGTTRAMLIALLKMGCPATWVTCDINQKQPKKGFYPDKKYKEAVESIGMIDDGDGFHYTPGTGVRSKMIVGSGYVIADDVAKIGPIAWCFLDGCHCEECVRAELAAYAPKIEPGGFLLMHDCTEEYRGYAPDQHYHGGALRGFKVIEVVEEWEKEHPEFKYITTTPAKGICKGKFKGGMRVLRKEF